VLYISIVKTIHRFVLAAVSAVLLVNGAGRLMAGEPATAVATVTAGYVSSITVTAGGSGYSSEPTVTITGGGGSGASARAILSGNKVGLVIVLNAGSGYTAPPSVEIELPPKETRVAVRLAFVITVDGPLGSVRTVEWSTALGPGAVWMVLKNVVIGPSGAEVVDLEVGATTRFYRAITPPTPAGYVYIQPGTFVMGSPTSELGRDSDEVQHPVTLTRGFWISDHETTQAEYQAVTGGNPSTFSGTDLPVETLSWDDAVLYCQKLTQREVAAGRLTAGLAYRLPTEAEWEYAARAGTTGAFYGNLDAIAWYDLNSGKQTHPVKGKQANEWGLFDASGNVWEWCSDWYGNYPAGPVTDPTGDSSGSLRVFRGGGWYGEGGYCRSAIRGGNVPGYRSSNLGLRPVLSLVR